MKFEIGVVSVELDSPAQYPLQVRTELIQAKDISASGVTHVESFEVQTDVYVYTFRDMSADDYEDLFNFFVDNAEGMLNEIDLTDDEAVERTGRFNEPYLNFQQDHFGLWSGSFPFKVTT